MARTTRWPRATTATRPHNSIVAKYAVKALNGFRHSYAFTTGNFDEPIRITAAEPGGDRASVSLLSRRPHLE